MSKYNPTKYYWLQLKEDFFDQDAIEWLEEQPDGIAQAYFYMKLCVKSLKMNGLLYRKVGEMILPYDLEKLSAMTRVPIVTVKGALVNLRRCGLIQILENGEIYMTQVSNMIGSQSIGAFKKQQQRQISNNSNKIIELEHDENNNYIEGGQMSAKCRTDIDLELELDKDINIDIDKEQEIKKENDVNVIDNSFELSPQKIEHCPYSQIVDLFNSICDLPKVTKITEQRKKAIKARWIEYKKDIEVFKTVFWKIKENLFLKGLNDRNWIATFDWIFKPSNFIKILEGNYDKLKAGAVNGKQRTENVAIYAEQPQKSIYKETPMPEWAK